LTSTWPYLLNDTECAHSYSRTLTKILLNGVIVGDLSDLKVIIASGNLSRASVWRNATYVASRANYKDPKLIIWAAMSIIALFKVTYAPNMKQVLIW